MKRLFSAIVSAALLTGLCACTLHESVVDGPFSSGNVSAQPSHKSDSPRIPGKNSESPDPLDSPSPEYDPTYTLSTSIPALINGLEMPVSGATGYTSVELPLWSEIPSEDEEPEPTQDSPEPKPSSSEPPAVSDPPETSPPAESMEPAPDGPAESGQALEALARVNDPAETEPLSTQPPDENTQDPDPTEEPPLVTLSPTADPDPTDEPSPTPEPKPTETPDPYEDAVAIWEPGTAFLILKEDGDWWYVSRGNETGWIEHRYCMINLPDVVPSMIYDDTNSYSSLFVTCGRNIPGITGEEIYNGNTTKTYNVRLDRAEYIMPILYSAARNICAAQHRALAEGNCIVVYQTFRPYDTQIKVAKAVSDLAKTDQGVKAGISTWPWSIDWFIATGVANHQRGYALDVSMVKVYGTETRYIGSLPYLYMTDFESYEMPTAMHELSIAAASTVSPSSTKLSDTMNANEPAKALRNYFTSSGLSPLASEWWHFNDEAANRATADKPSNGRYYLTECLSRLSW